MGGGGEGALVEKSAIIFYDSWAPYSGLIYYFFFTALAFFVEQDQLHSDQEILKCY